MTDDLAPEPKPERRICRTVDEVFAAGQEDARHDRPLSLSETARLAVLLRPYLTGPNHRIPQ